MLPRCPVLGDYQPRGQLGGSRWSPLAETGAPRCVEVRRGNGVSDRTPIARTTAGFVPPFLPPFYDRLGYGRRPKRRQTMMRMRALLIPSCCALFLACASSAPKSADSPDSSSPTSGEGAATTEPAATEGAAEAPKGAPTSATKKSGGPEAGLRTLDRRSVSMEFALTLIRNGSAAGVQSGNWSFEEERSHRIDTVDGGHMTGLQVVYGKWDAKPLLGLRYEVPTDGKTYDLRASGGAVAATRGAGEALSADEKSAVLAEYGYLGAPHPILAALQSTDWKVGAPLQVTPAIVYSLLGAIPGVDHRKTQLTAVYQGSQADAREQVKLELQVKAELASGETIFGIELRGPATVDRATGFVTSVQLEGALTPGGKMKVSGKMLEVRGKGSVKLERKAIFR
jgi:hypothetical protein